MPAEPGARPSRALISKVQHGVFHPVSDAERDYGPDAPPRHLRTRRGVAERGWERGRTGGGSPNPVLLTQHV